MDEGSCVIVPAVLLLLHLQLPVARYSERVSNSAQPVANTLGRERSACTVGPRCRNNSVLDSVWTRFA